MTDWPASPDATVNALQVAALYGVTSLKTIRRYIREGRIPPPESMDRMSWRAGDVLEYRKAWNLVQIVTSAAKGNLVPVEGKVGTSADITEKATRQRSKPD